jgi:hypothetical protein
VLLMARRNAPTMQNPIEEPLDVISMAVEVWAEADRISAVPAWWDVRPATAQTHERSNLDRVVGLVGENHSAAR